MDNKENTELLKKKIIGIVEKINNQELLTKIYTFIKTWLE